MKITASEISRVDEIIKKHDASKESLIGLLQKIQKEVNYLSEPILKKVAMTLDMPLSKIYGVATFYSMFSVKPKGKYVIMFCSGAPCYVEGADDIVKAVKKEVGIRFNEVSEDGLFSMERVSCLGLCGVAPVMMINEEAYGNLTVDKAVGIIKEYKERG